MIHAAGNSGAGTGIVLLHSGAAGRITIVQISGSIGCRRNDFIDVGVQSIGNVFRQGLCGVCGGEVGNQHLCFIAGDRCGG